MVSKEECMKTTRSIFALVLLVSLFLGACGKSTPSSQAGDLQGTITVSGAFALYPMMQRWAEEFTGAHPGVQFDVSAGGAGKGMTDALSGAVDIGMVSRAISPEEEAQGAFWVPVVIDAVFPTVSSKNPVLQDLMAKGISQETFTKIFITGEIKTWGQVVGKPEISDEIHIYTRSDACGAADVWAKYLGNKKQEDLLGIGVSGDPGLLDAVIKDPLGIGYNNLNYAFDAQSGQPVNGAAIIPIDKNNNGTAESDEVLATKQEAQQAVANGTYPAPPARALNLVTKGKPSGLVQAFIKWILADGQQFVGEAGYIQLPADQLNEALDKIK
jgi:phosphate transport system substrate-binding protein